MAPITTSVEVESSAEEAFDYVTDPSHFVDWQQGVVRGHMEGDGPHGAGDKCITTRRMAGLERSVTSEITHIERPWSWGVRGVDGPIRAIVDVRVTAPSEGGKTRVSITLDFAGHGIGKLLVPLVVRPNAAKEMTANMARLKQRLENPN